MVKIFKEASPKSVPALALLEGAEKQSELALAIKVIVVVQELP